MALKEIYNDTGNRGSAVVEAIIILPLFIFAVLAIYQMGQCRLAECDIYEAAAETIEYMAEYSYLGECTLMIPEIKFEEYIDDSDRIESYVSGGARGIDFWGTVVLDEDYYVKLQVNYEVVISLPFMPPLSVDRSINIKQKAYVGDKREQENKDAYSDDMYVYVTDNREVYHSTRSCTHLRLSVSMSSPDVARSGGYTECSFCGDMGGECVFITEEGNRFHYDLNCSGLKRTVYRVRLNEVKGIGGCKRCVGY